MQITVKLFALMREKAGTDMVVLDVPEGSTVTQAVTRLVQQYPSLETYMAKVRYALQMDFVDPSAPMRAGDELALIPPVSGGMF